MSGHGGSGIWGGRPPAAQPAGGQASTAAPDVAGFRHVLDCADAPVTAFRVTPAPGAPPVLPVEAIDALRRQMRGLAQRVSGCQKVENPDIPSGYTYLLQFVAHDLVATTVPFWATGDAAMGVRNDRQARLHLDTLYGGGPAVEPLPYAPEQGAASRSKLRLGAVQAAASPDGAAAAARCPFRDLARVATAPFDPVFRPAGAPLVSGAPVAGATDVLAADPRNDDHVIVSQLTVVFHTLHNTVVDLIRSWPPAPPGSYPEAAGTAFVCAREATRLIYRRIIRHDLLPKILHPAVRAWYDPVGADFGTWTPQFLDDAADRRLPLEFSHAAFRFGHAMIRDIYAINDINQTAALSDVMWQCSARSPQNMPLTQNWLVDWTRFFHFTDAAGTVTNPDRPNRSRLIGPGYGSSLVNASLFPLDGDPLGSRADGFFGLPYSDLMSSGLAGLWSVGPLLQAMAAKRTDGPWAGWLKPLLAGKWREELQAWLGTCQGLRSYDAAAFRADVPALAADPPLLFFILYEARFLQRDADLNPVDPDHAGRHLGLLGSILVAETLYGALLRDRLGPEIGAASPDEALGRVFAATSRPDADDLAALGRIGSMAGLIDFVRTRNGW